MLLSSLDSQAKMGKPPIRKEELQNTGVSIKNQKGDGDLVDIIDHEENHKDEDDFDGLNEEEILKRVMEESLKSAKEEELKRNKENNGKHEESKVNGNGKKNGL